MFTNEFVILVQLLTTYFFSANKMSYVRCYCRYFNRYNLQTISKRLYSSTHQKTTTNSVDPKELTASDLHGLHESIRQELRTNIPQLNACSQYYFDGQGKLFRPMTAILMAKACNVHKSNESFMSDSQKKIAMIAEMIHTASLLHDDVIDDATTRRNKVSVNHMFSDKQAILAGDFILSRATILLAKIGNPKAVEFFARIIDDLVKGELMQLMPKNDFDERFNHYIAKTFRKTASLVAYSCQTVALLGDVSPELQTKAFNYGKNIGIAFQLIDDCLDFVASSEELGKAASADLSLGLATAPVLFAAEQFPELNVMIERRFKEYGDVKHTFQLVQQSDSIAQTFMLARRYASEAVKEISMMENSIEKQALLNLSKLVVDRKR